MPSMPRYPASFSHLTPIAIASLIGFLGTACTTAMYPGPRRGDKETALFRPGKNTMVLRIDGRAVDGGSAARYEILPGRHEIVAVAEAVTNGETLKSEAINVCFSAKPMHVYKIRTFLERTELDDVVWKPIILDTDSDRDVKSECRENPVSSPAAGATDVSAAVAPAAPPVGRGHSMAGGLAANPTPQEPLPGTGFHLGLGLAFGGDKLATGTYTNGEQTSLTAGSGLFLSAGGTLTPIWYGNTYGLGIGGSFGLKFDHIGASNGDVSFIRYPLDLWVQLLMRVSGTWHLAVAGGPHKEYGANLSGTGIAQGMQADLQSPLGWTGEFGLHWSPSWYTAYAFFVRLTKVRYANNLGSVDGTNVGLGVAFHINL